MRLTAELVNSSLSYVNALKERELDLRGHKIPAIENLGVTKDQYESIDFTDNDIATLGNFPLSARLQTLLLARNRVHTIQASLSKSLPSLSTLVLTHNNVAELADLDALQGLTRLTHVSLVENPVASKENYRYYILWRCPSIRFLDFQKVKDAERKHAAELFGTYTQPTELAQSIMANKSKGFAPTVNGTAKKTHVKLGEKEKARFEKLVMKAKTLEQVRALEKAFAEGRLPAGGDDDDAMDET